MKRRGLVAGICWFWWCACAAADLPPLIPRQVLFGNPEKTSPQISPDGKYLAYLAPDHNNVLQVWLRTLGKKGDRLLTAEHKRGIHSYFWTYDGERLVYAQDQDGDENYHLISINIKDGEIRDLTPFLGVRAELVDVDARFPREILVGLNRKNRARFDVYRINLVSGAVDFDTKNPGNVVHWTADADFQIRAATAGTPDGGYDFLVRQSARDPWEKKYHWSDQGSGLAFANDGKTLYLLGSHHANALRLLALNLETDDEKVIAEDPEYDITGVLIHPTDRIVQAVSFNKEKVVKKVLVKSIAQDFKVLAKLHRGQFSLLSRNQADTLWLVAYANDDSPIAYYLYDRPNRKGSFLFTHQPRLEDLELAAMKPISFKARDGLLLRGYLTTPVGIPAKNLPAVLLVHGGPWSRDSWGFNATVQWLANRGYAVLQVNFRGSRGYGKKFLNAGDRQWGLKMQDDLSDGVRWLIDQGIANPKKIAIMGSSYGGYATLAGLTFTPDTFACGVDMVGPSNLITLLRSFPPYWGPVKAMFTKRVGNLDKDADSLKARSPLFFADRIKVPLLIAQGANDPRVKPAESDQIVAALRKAKKPVGYIIYTDEGHGLVRPENRLHFSAQVEAFLARHLGGRAEPPGEIKGHSAKIIGPSP